MESIRIKRDNIYRIEVNDAGEYIEFDLQDIGLRARCYRTLDKIKEMQKEYEKKAKLVKSNKQLAFFEEEMFKDLRSAMDEFLGEGACQKIFGDVNYADMFNDLLDELTRPRKELKGKSHFDMLKINATETNKKIMEKYSKMKKNVI